MKTIGNRISIAATVLVVLTVLVAGATDGFGTGSYLSDEEEAKTAMSAAGQFSTTALLGADYVLDVKHAGRGERSIDGDDQISWRFEEVGPEKFTLTITAKTESPLTFAVERKALLRAMNLDSLDTVRASLDDGSMLDYRVEMAQGTEWLVFTVDRFSTREIHFETGVASGGVAGLDSGGAEPAGNATIKGNGTVANSTLDPIANGTVTNSTSDPVGNNSTVESAPDPVTNGTVEHGTAGPGSNATVEGSTDTNITADGSAPVDDGSDSPTNETASTDGQSANEATSTDDGSTDETPSTSDGSGDATTTTDDDSTSGDGSTSTTDDGSDSTTETTTDDQTSEATTTTTTSTPESEPESTDGSTETMTTTATTSDSGGTESSRTGSE